MTPVTSYISHEPSLPGAFHPGTDELSSARGNFEEQYLALRKKENRMYSDEELLMLPDIRSTHPHYKEWLARKRSFRRLFTYLQNKEKPLQILEIGCGNGWLSHRLAMLCDSEVTGIDINRTEVEQAARAFTHHAGCTFLYGDLHSGVTADRKFDIIIFAASIQYFSSLNDIMAVSMRHLKKGGEIHFLDSPFYKTGEQEAARQRSESYFNKIGFPGMSRHYFHHDKAELHEFKPSVLFDPYSWRNRFFRNRSPFYWLCIKND